MSETDPPLNLALDEPGSAGPITRRYGLVFLVLVLAAAFVIVPFRGIELAVFPNFTIFHASFLFVVNGVVSFMLFANFAHRRLRSYAILGSAYLFAALIAIPFVLSFPGALRAEGGVIGGEQSSVWVWHAWHIVFPIMIVIALLVHEYAAQNEVERNQVASTIGVYLAVAVGLTLLVTFAVTLMHDRLPILITGPRLPLTTAFYALGAVATTVTVCALALTIWMARSKAMLHIWLAIALAAFMGDMISSLAASARYTLGWYFSRVESMMAAIFLLLVLLSEILRVYHRLGTALSELRVREQAIRHLAYFDPVTDLPNRRLLMDRLKQDLAQAKRNGDSMALLFLDLDNFKQVNDRLGHEAGDKLLHEVGRRVTRCVRSGDTVSRLGGDEFVIVLPEIAHVRDAEVTAQKILIALSEPSRIASESVQITTSIGIAIVSPDTSLDAHTLLARADAAMYCAKNAGRNRYALGD